MESKRRRNVHARVYERDKWQCKMLVCAADSRDIDPALAGYDDPWAPSIDHVIRLADGGRDVEGNMRAAHKFCNNLAGRSAAYTIGEKYPDLLFLAREIVRSD